MNIFAVDNNPAQAAIALPDKLVVKMPTESLQMLSAWAFREFNFTTKKTTGETYGNQAYRNNPCTLWLHESPSNAWWAYMHAQYLCEEYTERYGREHGILYGLSQFNTILEKHFSNYNWTNHTDFVMCMPDQYKAGGDPVRSYREFIMGEKGYAVWKHGNEPTWWDHEKHKPARERYLAEQEQKRLKRLNAHPRISRSLQKR